MRIPISALVRAAVVFAALFILSGCGDPSEHPKAANSFKRVSILPITAGGLLHYIYVYEIESKN